MRAAGPGAILERAAVLPPAHREPQRGAVTAGAPQRDRQAVRRHLLHAAVRISFYSVALFTLYALAPLGRRRGGWIVLELALDLLVLGLVLAWQIRAIIRSPFPRLQAVQAVAISIPLLIVSFAATYVEVAQASPGSFTEPVSRVGGVYFTVTVLATVGFGDIAATSDAARLIVTGQMIADLVLVGLIARVIFNTAQQRRESLAKELAEQSAAFRADPGDESDTTERSRSSRAGDAGAGLPLQSDRGRRR
jgi:voltage-gated potassium channel